MSPFAGWTTYSIERSRATIAMLFAYFALTVEDDDGLACALISGHRQNSRMGTKYVQETRCNGQIGKASCAPDGLPAAGN
jgi:hypothetical protein